MRVNRSQILVSLFLILSVSPVLAHQMKVSGDVAAMFHIDPKDHPKAKVASQTWFALTMRGGRTIPLSQCDCHLAVYPIPHQEGITPPLFRPVLKPLNVEGYRGVPSAVVTFPKPGLYEIELKGKPLSGKAFSPFEFSYEVTVTE
jgi:hypothetical protein